MTYWISERRYFSERGFVGSISPILVHYSVKRTIHLFFVAHANQPPAAPTAATPIHIALVKMAAWRVAFALAVA